MKLGHMHWQCQTISSYSLTPVSLGSGIANFWNQELSFVGTVYRLKDLDRSQVICKQWKVSSVNILFHKNDNSRLRKDGIKLIVRFCFSEDNRTPVNYFYYWVLSVSYWVEYNKGNTQQMPSHRQIHPSVRNFLILWQRWKSWDIRGLWHISSWYSYNSCN